MLWGQRQGLARGLRGMDLLRSRPRGKGMSATAPCGGIMAHFLNLLWPLLRSVEVVRPLFLLRRIPPSMDITLGRSVQQAPHRDRTLSGPCACSNKTPALGVVVPSPRLALCQAKGPCRAPTVGPGARPTLHGSTTRQIHRKGDACNKPMRRILCMADFLNLLWPLMGSVEVFRPLFLLPASHHRWILPLARVFSKLLAQTAHSPGTVRAPTKRRP